MAFVFVLAELMPDGFGGLELLPRFAVVPDKFALVVRLSGVHVRGYCLTSDRDVVPNSAVLLLNCSVASIPSVEAVWLSHELLCYI